MFFQIGRPPCAPCLPRLWDAVSVLPASVDQRGGGAGLPGPRPGGPADHRRPRHRLHRGPALLKQMSPDFHE